MTQAIRKTAPEPLSPVPFAIPQAFQSSLENGLKIVLFKDKRLPLVSLRLAFFSGDAHDPADSIGLTSAMTAMLTEGTRQYSSREVAEKIERLGASISASSSEDFTIIAGSSLSLYSSDILQLLAEILLKPTFPEAELDLYRRNTIENLKFQRSQPNYLANEQVARILYGEHPYATLSPKPEDIEKLTRQKLIEYHGRSLIPNNCVLVAVGDVERDEFLSEIKEHFGKWRAGEKPETAFPVPPKLETASLTIVDRPGSAQANIVIAGHAFDRSSPDYFPALVMNQILGAGASSRVFMNLREEKGYTYGAYTRIDSKKLGGEIEATAEVRTAVTGDSLKEFFYELDRIRNESVADEELADAKNFLTGVFPIRAETQEGLTNLIVNQQLYGLPDDYLQTYRDNVSAVTADEVKRVAEKYVVPERMAIVIVGDAGDILPQARQFASSVDVFDTDGNRRDLNSYETSDNDTPADASGKWKLSLDFQGQQVPVSLELDQAGDKLTGTLETILGSGTITDGTISGRKVAAAAITEIQGQSVDFIINATVDEDKIAGSISAAVIPDALSFTGVREK